MKKIGFIDYYLDEWHANNYPEWIKKASEGAMEVAYAYAKIDAEDGIDNETWCQQKGITRLSSIEEVVEKSDYIIVLSPDHPEMHEELAMPALKSGKPTYVDKTFAPDRKTAELLVETAAKHHTPMFSASALRFASNYKEIKGNEIDMIFSRGPGDYSNYAVHQIEPIIALIDAVPQRMMFIGTEHSPALLIEFADGKKAVTQHCKASAFSLAVNYVSGEAAEINPEADFFSALIDAIIRFFETGETPVPSEQTIAIMTAIEYGAIAAKTPHQWIELPQ